MTCKQKKFVEYIFYRALISHRIRPKFSFIHSSYKEDGVEFFQTFVIKNDKTVAVFDRLYIESDGHVLNYELMFA